ncbi:hypothetical protein GCM10011408_11140 [Dyella caseinilytica]|nr:hypothetical protein GCM10011408_11140 [Dyella caseinilytica]
MNHTRHQGDGQHAFGKILRLQADARGDIAAIDDQVAGATHDQAYTFVPDATGCVLAEVTLYKPEIGNALAHQANTLQSKAVSLLRQGKVVEGGGNFAIQTNIGRPITYLTLLRLSLCTFALLLLVRRDGRLRETILGWDERRHDSRTR